MKTKFKIGDQVTFTGDDITREFIGLPDQKFFVVRLIERNGLRVDNCEYSFEFSWFRRVNSTGSKKSS